jgi:tetratricopeptide (TPR) repeat protein
MSKYKGSMRKLLVLSAVVMAAGALAAACSSPAAITPGGSPSTGTSPSQLLNSGVTALNSGDTATAKTDFNAVISTDPSNKYSDNSIAYYDLGVIAQSAGQTSAAVGDYQNAIKLNPNYVGAEYNLAIEETASNPQGAITLYRQVILTSPSDVNAIYNLGLLLYETGDKTQGDTYLNQAISIAPSLAKKLPAGVTP